MPTDIVMTTTTTTRSPSTATSPPPLRRETLDGVAVLTLDSPSSRNALSEMMIGALHAALDSIRDDAGVRAVVIAANGPAYSSGHDLKELTAHRADPDAGFAYFTQIMNACSAMMQAIVRLPKPVVAAVQGIATAAGCQLVATCDLAVASENAKFATPGIDIGLFCSTPMVALSRNATRKQAMEMLLTGETIDASTAREFGLVNRVVPREYLNQVVSKYTQTIASKSPLTLKIGKEAFYRQAEMGLADAYDYAARVMVDNMMARDAEEGIGAFVGKRQPEWKGE